MTNQTEETYDLKEPATVAISSAPIVSARRQTRQISGPFHLIANILTWTMVATFLVGGAVWALGAGMDLRRDIWQSTRIIRFKEDIMRGFEFGNDAMRFAESNAQLEPKADAMAEQSPRVLARAGFSSKPRPNSVGFRRLTTLELMRGLVAYIDDVVQSNPGGDYDLDYPPLRLAVMTLWVRHVQRLHPDMDCIPGQRIEDTGLVPG